MRDDTGLPYKYSFPTVLTFKATDGDNNVVDVMYIKAETHIALHGTFENLVGCFEDKPQVDFIKDGGSND